MFDIIFPQFFLFAIGIIFGIIPPFLWGMNGGDEGIIINQPQLKTFLGLIHHWQIGIIIIFIGLALSNYFPSDYNAIVYGWGITTFLDDALFHSFEHSFVRKEEK